MDENAGSVKSHNESQSLTRQHRSYQYRFKSLSTHHQSTNALDSTMGGGELSIDPSIDDVTSIARQQKLSLTTAAPAGVSNNNNNSNNALAAASAAATTSSSLSASQMSNSSSNLLSPRAHINFISKFFLSRSKVT